MNIEIANRLLDLRKEHKLSQEELAARLNISRQAVSKWERAEASPDTDNLIELSKLYGITLDELLTGVKTVPVSENGNSDEQDAAFQSSKEAHAESTSEPFETATEEPQAENSATYQDHIDLRNGIHIHSANGDKVDIGFKGIHVEDQNGEKVHVGFDGVYVNDASGENWNHWNNHDWKPAHNNHKPFNWDGHYERTRAFKFWYAFPYPLLAGILFFVFGILGGWAWSWLMFLTIPLYYTTISAIEKSNPNIFCYPVLAAIVFFILGFWGGLWHPGWLVFLTIPFYYWLTSALAPKYHFQQGNDQNKPDML